MRQTFTAAVSSLGLALCAASCDPDWTTASPQDAAATAPDAALADTTPPDATPPDVTPPDGARDGGRPDQAVARDSADDGATDAGDAGAADARPSTIPIIFVHGHGGALSDWHYTMQWLTENDPRWNSSVEAGTDSYQDWEVGEFAPAQWLFNFTYYNRFPSDESYTYTAGPGRIGSNGDYLCPEHGRPGYLPADRDEYYSDQVRHEYARDLADFIATVVRVTGAPAVDLVTHSMGGLVARSVAQYFEAGQNIRRMLLVAVPNKGFDLVDFAFLDPRAPRWMVNLEFVEIDATASWWDIAFFVCGTEREAAAWPVGLNATDGEAASRITYYSILGSNDLYLNAGTADYDRSEWFIEVQGADHTTIRNTPETRDAIVRYLGTAAE
ncbi:MAG: alpha/beta hydrolase [Deltaproteobacteria bacterium]|nr:alpha/beta hydrolase [Deltaproteobacteria bacterium]